MDVHDQQQPEDVPPPIDSDMENDMYDEDEIPRTKWPKVIGIISLIYAIIGLTCMTTSGVFLVVMPMIPPEFRGGVDFPPIIRITGIVSVFLLLIIGIIMVIGAVNLLRRRRSGVSKLKLWVVLRLILILISIGVFILTSSAQISMARSQQDYVNDMLRERGLNDRVKEKSDQELWNSSLIKTGVATGANLIYPLFLGLYLSRKKVTEEISYWS